MLGQLCVEEGNDVRNNSGIENLKVLLEAVRDSHLVGTSVSNLE